MRLKDRVGIITGASSGIGEAVEDLFAREGAKLALVAGRNIAVKKTKAGIALKAIRAEKIVFTFGVYFVERAGRWITCPFCLHVIKNNSFRPSSFYHIFKAARLAEPL
jgi:NAD(P)-dependent dehydrogenase (short-subunit alcohol dehydrogenase family)